MGYAIPVKIYEQLEQKLGREAASVIVEALEASIREALKDGKSQVKNELADELKKELATKHDIGLVKKDIELVMKEIELVRKDMKILGIVLIAVIILLNQSSLEFIARLLGLLK